MSQLVQPLIMIGVVLWILSLFLGRPMRYFMRGLGTLILAVVILFGSIIVAIIQVVCLLIFLGLLYSLWLVFRRR